MSSMRLNLWVLLSAIAGPAYGGCEQSLDVDPAKTISSVGVFLAMPEAGLRPISCSTAERFRAFLFVRGATKIDNSALVDLGKYQQTMRAQRTVLEKAISDAEPNPTRILVDVALLQYGKYSTIIACAAPEPTASKAACAIGLGTAMLASYDLTNNITKLDEALLVAKLGLASHDALYRNAMDLKAAQGITPAQGKLKATFDNMCQAIQKHCSK